MRWNWLFLYFYCKCGGDEDLLRCPQFHPPLVLHISANGSTVQRARASSYYLENNFKRAQGPQGCTRHTWRFTRLRMAHCLLSRPSYLRLKSFSTLLRTARRPGTIGRFEGVGVAPPLMLRTVFLHCLQCLPGRVRVWYIRGSNKGGLVLEPRRRGLICVMNLECAPKSLNHTVLF